MTMEDVNKTVTTTMGATPAHATLDMLAMASMDVWVCSLVSLVSRCLLIGADIYNYEISHPNCFLYTLTQTREFPLVNNYEMSFIHRYR